MDFNDWVDDVGGCGAAAGILREKRRTVQSWYRKEKVPRLAQAMNIVTRSERVDYNGLYAPFARARVSATALSGRGGRC